MIIVALAFGAAALWQETVPDISPSYIIVVGLLLGFVLVPRFGNLWAARRGAPMLTREERTRRYLGEFGPIPMPPLRTMDGQRRTGGRSLRRG